MNDDLLGWNTWSETFANWSDISISELHGIMTGLMTMCNAPSENIWAKVLDEISLSPLEPSALRLLTEEAEDICFLLKDKEDAYGYAPLVPDDEHELYERVLALKDWASGYITGIGLTDCSLNEVENEALADLARIGAIRINPDDEFEGGEEQYLYLYEFARLVPVTLATRKRKLVEKLPLIAGMPI